LSPKEQEDLDERLGSSLEILTTEEHERATQTGSAMSLNEALDYALDHPANPAPSPAA